MGTELQTIHDTLKVTAPKNFQIENMGTGCIWVHGKSLKGLNALADTMRTKFPNATFRVNTLGGNNKMVVNA